MRPAPMSGRPDPRESRQAAFRRLAYTALVYSIAFFWLFVVRLAAG